MCSRTVSGACLFVPKTTWTRAFKTTKHAEEIIARGSVLLQISTLKSSPNLTRYKQQRVKFTTVRLYYCEQCCLLLWTVNVLKCYGIGGPGRNNRPEISEPVMPGRLLKRPFIGPKHHSQKPVEKPKAVPVPNKQWFQHTQKLYRKIPASRPVYAIRHLGRGHTREHNLEIFGISSELSRKSGW